MANISDIISISVTVADNAPNAASFGVPLVLVNSLTLAQGQLITISADSAGLAELVSVYGMTVTESAYRIASAIAAQNPGVDKLKIYSRTRTAPQRKVTISPTKTTQGFVYRWRIDDTDQSYTVLAAATTTTIATAIAALIDPLASVAATASVGVITVDPAVTGNRWFLSGFSKELTVKDTSTDDGIATDLAAAAILDPEGWFGIVLDSWSELEINAAAAWAEANSKMFWANSMDSDVVSASATDVASDVKAAGYHFTNVMFSRDQRGNAAASILSREFSQDPGASTAANKTLAGVVGDALTGSELAFARGKNAMTFTMTKGVSHTLDGKAGSGRFLDITRGIEWLKARIQEDLFTLILNQGKVPYTDAGYSLVQSTIARRLGVAEDAGLLVPGLSKVFVPKAADALTADKIARVMKGVTFSAQLQGAAHSITIVGTVTV